MNIFDEKKLIDALRPFAALSQPHQDWMPSDRPIWGVNDASIRVFDVRRAAEYVREYDETHKDDAASDI